MKITWLGQAGLLFESGLRVMIDPYLSDSVAAVEPANARRVPVDERFFAEAPDVMIFTHNHLDHYDPETVERFFALGKRMLILCPRSVWAEVRKLGGGHNFVCFDAGTEWTEGGIRFRAVPAVHSDFNAIGVLISAEEKNYYVTGDTLYSAALLKGLPELEAIFLPINGVGNNMNAFDAARLAVESGAKYKVPLHVGLFDAIRAADVFEAPGRVIPEFYREIVLG